MSSCGPPREIWWSRWQDSSFHCILRAKYWTVLIREHPNTQPKTARSQWEGKIITPHKNQRDKGQDKILTKLRENSNSVTKRWKIDRKRKTKHWTTFQWLEEIGFIPMLWFNLNFVVHTMYVSYSILANMVPCRTKTTINQIKGAN